MFDAFMPVLCIDEDSLGCNSLCYEWGGLGARGSSRRICLWGGRWISGLGSSGGECEGLIWECAGESPL